MTQIPPAVRPTMTPAPARTGELPDASWRGLRRSAPFIALLESALTDLAALRRRLRLLQPAPVPSVLPPAPAAGLLGVSVDPRLFPERALIDALGPDSRALAAVQVQALRTRLAFLLDPRVV